MTALASVNATSANSLDICEAPYMGVSEKVLACPGGRIEIVSAEYGRPGDDRDTCCSNAKKCLVNPGDQCTADATEWVKTECNGTCDLSLSIDFFNNFFFSRRIRVHALWQYERHFGRSLSFSTEVPQRSVRLH